MEFGKSKHVDEAPVPVVPWADAWEFAIGEEELPAVGRRKRPVLGARAFRVPHGGGMQRVNAPCAFLPPQGAANGLRLYEDAEGRTLLCSVDDPEEADGARHYRLRDGQGRIVDTVRRIPPLRHALRGIGDDIKRAAPFPDQGGLARPSSGLRLRAPSHTLIGLIGRKARQWRSAAVSVPALGISATTAAQPVSTTTQPVSTTAELVSLTAEPVSTTAEPVSLTAEPVSTTAEPVSLTADPGERLPDGAFGATQNITVQSINH
ncbi:hypothetical protein [Streptomyces sediminimaris]|uniref:hypothetical protein n=1 Tax=Streptomyces sediminimaris TaxID=3383721 RepID=UPI00399B3DE5